MGPATIPLLELRAALVFATGAMLALHLASTFLLRQGIRPVTLLRWEAIYYVLLLAALALPSFRRLFVPAIVLAAVHLSAWLYVEKHPPATPPNRRVLRGVLLFDSAEAVVLAWIIFAIV